MVIDINCFLSSPSPHPLSIQSIPTILNLISFLPFIFITEPSFSSSVLIHSQPSSCSPSPALSIESLSSGSDHSSSQPRSGGGASSDQEHSFTKSVSEPSICSPCSSTASPSSSSTERLPHPTPGPSPSPVPSNASSAPATPQTSRSSGNKGTGAPPPRPTTTPSPLASGAGVAHNKVVRPPSKKQFKAIKFTHYIPAVSLFSF